MCCWKLHNWRVYVFCVETNVRFGGGRFRGGRGRGRGGRTFILQPPTWGWLCVWTTWFPTQQAVRTRQCRRANPRRRDRWWWRQRARARRGISSTTCKRCCGRWLKSTAPPCTRRPRPRSRSTTPTRARRTTPRPPAMCRVWRWCAACCSSTRRRSTSNKLWNVVCRLIKADFPFQVCIVIYILNMQ